MRVGYIGLGAMGGALARHLVGKHSLTVFDLNKSIVNDFCAQGAKSASTCAELASDCEVVILCLPRSSDVKQVLFGPEGLAQGLSAGAVVIDQTSGVPGETYEFAQQLLKIGVSMLDAPVSGGVRRAIDGSLAVMVGGDEKILKQMEPVLTCLGKTITHVGNHGAGHAVKALNNYVSAAGLVAAAEATLAGQAFGLDPNVMADVFNGSTGRNNTTEHKLKQFMLSGTFAAGFSLRLMEKDVATALELGVGQGQEMALCKRLTQMWHDAADALPPTADHTAIYGFLEQTQTKH